MTTSVLVTSVVPTFNRAKVLERCLESALGQSYSSVEVIVCDNASTDRTREVVTRAFAGHRRARYVRHDSNLGAPEYNPTAAYAHDNDVVSFQVVDRPTGETVRVDHVNEWPGVGRPMLDWTVHVAPSRSTTGVAEG